MTTEEQTEEQTEDINTQELNNKKYFIAVINILNAYKLIKNESEQLDMFLLSISSSLIEKINFNEFKIKEEEVNLILEKIKSNDISLEDIENELNDYISFIK